MSEKLDPSSDVRILAINSPTYKVVTCWKKILHQFGGTKGGVLMFDTIAK